jgi:hypothetical protein
MIKKCVCGTYTSGSSRRSSQDMEAALAVAGWQCGSGSVAVAVAGWQWVAVGGSVAVVVWQWQWQGGSEWQWVAVAG